MQTRTWSFIEACTNTLIGFVLSWGFTLLSMQVLGIEMTFSQLWWYTIFMTFVSVGRGYVLRRLFNSEVWKRKKEHAVVIPDDEEVHGLPRERIQAAEVAMLRSLQKERSKTVML